MSRCGGSLQPFSLIRRDIAARAPADDDVRRPSARFQRHAIDDAIDERGAGTVRPRRRLDRSGRCVC